MARAMRTCPRPGCPTLVEAGTGACAQHQRSDDRARGTRQQRGYGVAHEKRFRHGVLSRDPLCVCIEQAHGHGTQCLAASTVADHWPRDKRELIALGLDDHDPTHGRGLCKPCHDRHTASAQPGGWNAQRSR